MMIVLICELIFYQIANVLTKSFCLRPTTVCVFCFILLHGYLGNTGNLDSRF